MNISLIIHLHTQPMVTSLKKSWQETNVTRITWVDHSLTLIHMDTILKCLVRPTLNLFIVLIDGLLLKARKRSWKVHTPRSTCCIFTDCNLYYINKYIWWNVDLSHRLCEE